MFLDPDRFAFRHALASHWEAIRAEALALPEQDWFRWEDEGSFSGAWHIAPLFTALFDNVPMTHVIEAIPRVSGRCPVTTAALAGIPGLTDACFSRLMPGAHIHAHSDHEGFGHTLRGHLALDVPSGCGIRVIDEIRTWTEGEMLFFAGTAQHEAANQGDRPRIVLLIDLDAEAHPPLDAGH